MKKLVVLLALLAAIGGSAFAQTIVPIVGGVVTADVGRNNTFKVLLNANVTSVVLSSNQTPAGGQIITIFFTENATGGFTVSFGGNISNACSVTTTANVTTACQFQFNGTDGTWYGTSGSSSSSGASPFSNSYILSTNCGSAPNCFPVIADTKYISDPTFTNGSGNVVCPNNDCAFTSADIGKVCWGTNATTDVSNITSTVIMPEGTIDTVTDASHAHCTQNATANTTASGFFVWGHLDTPANGAGGTDNIAAASLAAANACQPLFLPTGVLMIEQVNNIGNVGPANGFCSQNSAVNTRKGFAIIGQGSTSTVILITPNTRGTNCTGPNATSVGCYLSLPNMYATGFQMTCLGNSALDSSFNNKSLVYLSGLPINGGSNFRLLDVILQGCAGTNTGVIGLDIGHGVANSISGGSLENNIFEAFGQTTVSYNPGVATSILQSTMNQMVVAGLSGNALAVQGGYLTSHGDILGFTSSTTNNAVACLGAASICTFEGDFMGYQTGAGVAELQCGASGAPGAVCQITDSIITNPTVNGFGVSTGGNVTNPSFIYAKGSRITSVTANRAIALNQPDQFFDGCNNVIGTVTLAANSKVFGSCSTTGTLLIATNVTPSTGWGTTGAAGNGVSAPSGDAHKFTFTITATGTPTANPTVAVTFPTAYLAAPGCSAQQINQSAGAAISQLTTTTGPSATSVTFTWNGTPAAAATYTIQGSCQ